MNRMNLKEGTWTIWLLEFEIIMAIVSGPFILPFAVQTRSKGMIGVGAITVIVHLFFVFMVHCGLMEWFRDPLVLQMTGTKLNLQNPVFAIDTNAGKEKKMKYLLTLLKKTN